MSIAKEVTFQDGVTPVSAAWLNLMQEMLAAYVSPNFRLEASSSTQIRVVAGNNEASVAIAMDGQLRRRDTNATLTMSGGAGIYAIYATADSGDDVFALEAVANQGASAATNSRRIGTVGWDGSAITSVTTTLFGNDTGLMTTYSGHPGNNHLLEGESSGDLDPNEFHAVLHAQTLNGSTYQVVGNCSLRVLLIDAQTITNPVAGIGWGTGAFAGAPYMGPAVHDGGGFEVPVLVGFGQFIDINASANNRSFWLYWDGLRKNNGLFAKLYDVETGARITSLVLQENDIFQYSVSYLGTLLTATEVPE